MEYTYIIRKYRLKKPSSSRYVAFANWMDQVKDSDPDEFLVDEFPVQERRKEGLLKAVIKQVIG